MQTINTGTVHLFTYKEGLLSAVAHDLRLTVREFSVEIDGDQIIARFRGDSIRVDGAMRSGRLDPGALKPKHAKEIVDTIQRKILKTRAHPEIVFRGRRQGMQVRGDLTLVGRSQPVEITVTHVGGRESGRVDIKPMLWGIAPYTAMFGTLKIQDRVTVAFDLPGG